MDLLKATEPLAAHVSWAVWPEVDLSRPLDDLDLSTPDLKASQVHVNAVIVGLNRSKEIGDTFLKWGNFHTAAKHNDHVLAGAFVGTPFEGALMVDLVDAVEGNSTNVPVTETDVTKLGEFVRSLGSDDPVFVGLGSKVYAGLHQHRVSLSRIITQSPDNWADPTGGERIVPETRIVKLPHYSSQNHRSHYSHPATYRARAHAALDEAFTADGWGDWRQPGLPRSTRT